MRERDWIFMSKKRNFEITAAILHIFAMALMLCDHMWAMLLPAQEWLTCIGRAAFPVFAFLLVEGYFHTHDLRRYLLRLLAGALLSEIPFDLMYGGSAFYPYHQNVLWTFLLSLLLVSLIEKARARFKPVAAAAASAGLALLGFLLGYGAMVDYYGAGVLMVLVFYFFHKRTWKNFAGQVICLYFLNVKLLGGYYYTISAFGHELEIVQQGLALLALLPIWLYRGKQGYHSRGFQVLCYMFYPIHMLILFVVREWILR